MHEIVIQRVKTARQRKQFLELPWTIYRNDPNWIPPLRHDQKENVGYAHNPFYDRNQIQTFLAYRGKEVVGRIGAILNQGHINRYDDQRGFFGFFESIDDQEVANALFDAARDWFADQGIFKLRGPVNPSLNATLGLLIDGFDSPPTFMMTYNPPYYERLIENYGFRKTQDLYAFWGHVSMLPKVAEKLAPICRADHRALQRQDSTAGQIALHRRRQDVPIDLQPLADQHLGLRADVRRRSRACRQGHEVSHRARTGRSASRSTGGWSGATFGLLDYNPRIKEIDGRLFPFGFMHLLRNKNGNQENPPDLHQRAARIPDARPGPGADARRRAQGAGMGHRGGRVLLGAGVQQVFPRRARAKAAPRSPRPIASTTSTSIRRSSSRCGSRSAGRRSEDGWKSGRSSPAAT